MIKRFDEMNSETPKGNFKVVFEGIGDTIYDAFEDYKKRHYGY
jgi:hypothetical protein